MTNGYVSSTGSIVKAGTDLNITQTGGTISGTQDGIYARNYGSGATSITVAGKVSGTGTTASSTHENIAGIFNSTSVIDNEPGNTETQTSTGVGIMTEENAGTTVTIDAKSGADISGTTNAIQDTNGNANVTLESGSTVSGAVRLGSGSDTLTVEGTANIDGTSAILDGGNVTDSSVTDTLANDTFTNKLNFQGTTQTVNGADLLNWETVTLTGSSLTLDDGILNTAGRLATGYTTDADGTTASGLYLTNASTLYSPATLAISGDVNIDASSELKQAVGGSINGDVTNAGLIYWGNLNHTLTISGNYTGISGSKLSLETYLAGDSSATDKLDVTGSTSGNSTVVIRPAAGSPGAQTQVGIDVINVAGTSAGTFALANPVQAGAYQYVLKKSGNGGDANDWYLVSHYIGGNTPVGPTYPFPIYRPGVGDYVSGQAVNAEEGFFTTANFHERRGENTITDVNGHQSWVRPYYYHFSADGYNRFSYSGAKLYGLQLGQDVWSSITKDGASKRVAVTLDYACTDTDFKDSLRPITGLDARIGSMHAQDVSIGGTYSRVAPSGAYLDLVAKLSMLRNKFDVADTGDAYQNGVREIGSIEFGKPFAMNKNWQIEPQAQLIYMHTRYDEFSDDVSAVSGYNTNALRGRLGVRIYNRNENDNYRRSQLYGIFDILHDFIGPSDVTVGGTAVSDDFRHTGFDIGLGEEYKINKTTSFYCRGQYLHSLIGNKSEGYLFSAGIKAQF